MNNSLENRDLKECQYFVINSVEFYDGRENEQTTSEIL